MSFFVKRSFELFEQLSDEIADWELDCRQLGRNDRPFELEQFGSDRLVYSRMNSDCSFYQIGGSQSGARTFALQASGCSSFHWCGEAINSQSLVVFPVNGEFESNSHPGFDVFTLSFSEELLSCTARLHYQRPLSDFFGAGHFVCNQSAHSVSELRALLHGISANMGRWSSLSIVQPTDVELMMLEEKLAVIVLRCLERDQPWSTATKLSKRMKSLGEVLRVIEETPIAGLNLRDVLARVEVSRRTIEHAFQDRFDISPAVYIKSLRLRSLNRALLVGDAGEASIRGICQQNGFSHLGQLANDYRKLYGELPSATLRRRYVPGTSVWRD